MAGAVTSMHTAQGNRIIAFGAHWPSEERYTVWHYFRMESIDNGHSWSNPQPLSLHNNHIAFGSPVRLANGELPLSRVIFRSPARAARGARSALVHAQSEAEALAMPAGEGGWHDRKFATHRHGCSVLVSPNEEASEFMEHGHIANRPLGLLEPSCIQLNDGPNCDVHARRTGGLPVARGKRGQRPYVDGCLAD